MITFKHKGDFTSTSEFLKSAQMSSAKFRRTLAKYGQIGVDALKEATPKDTGKTAASWVYKVSVTKKGCSIRWDNTNLSNGIPIVIFIQYGHATRNGGYVKGVDFINPTMKPIFDDILANVWKEVTNGGI